MAISPRAFIVAAKRTAGGRRNGLISHMHPAALGAAVVDALVGGLDADGALVDDVIMGCVSQVGSQTANVGRGVVLSSERLPTTVPGTTVDRQCGSSQQAIHFAAQAVMSGTQDVVIAGGVESMSGVPMFSAIAKGKLGTPNTEAMHAKFGATDEGFYSQFVSAELMCSKYDITREEMDAFAAQSHARGLAATTRGAFKDEIVPLMGKNQKTGEAKLHDRDEGLRGDTTAEALAQLDTLVQLGFCPSAGPEGGGGGAGGAGVPFGEGRITAGNASQICDGAAAVVVVNEAGLKKLGAEPLAEVRALALAGTDPVLMLSGPIPATERALAAAGLRIGDVDMCEVNEAFACVPMAWQKALGADPDRLNALGGAIALGHPLGGTGAKLMTTLVHEMRRDSTKRYGLLAICEGGGTANATIIERC